MDKLVEHAIRMLEISEGENDFFRNDAKRQADIARAVYDVIIHLEVAETQLLLDCTGCRFVGTYDTAFPCANCVRKNKDYYDSEQTERSG